MTIKKYRTPSAFLASLSERLKQKATVDGIDIQRLRRNVAFDRLLARLFINSKCQWILKGGYAMELRVSHSRTTKDIDLALKDLSLASMNVETQNSTILKELRTSAALNLNDFFFFQIQDSTLDLDGPPYGGARFPVLAQVDGRTFAKFHIDVGVGDDVVEPLDKIKGEDWLGFAGIDTKAVPTLSVEQHFAEKIHAYTLPREGRFNSRVKDLVDLILLIRLRQIDSKKLKEAVDRTFHRRNTHFLPRTLPDPPNEWIAPFEKIAKECKLGIGLEEAFNELKNFFTATKESIKWKT